MKNILLVSTLTMTMGCATAIMRPYVGQQQAWPTSEGSIVNVKYQIPIFNSLPPTPYDVLGELRVQSPFYAQPEEHHMSTIIAKAKSYGADALVLVDGQLFFGPSYGPRGGTVAVDPMMARTLTQVNRFLPESFRPGVSVIAIRWVQPPPNGLPGKNGIATTPSTLPFTPVEPKSKSTTSPNELPQPKKTKPTINQSQKAISPQEASSPSKVTPKKPVTNFKPANDEAR